ncbi:MAG: hypothetical protein WB681_10615 [Candidatus Cybelea sp.]
MTPNARFTEFLQDIEPSATTTSQAISAHQSMRDFLAKHTALSKRHVKTFLSGSYKRCTSIRPRTEGGVTLRPDIDIIVVTDHGKDDCPKGVLDELYTAIGDGYDDIRLQTRSVGVVTTKADMDVVPIIEPYGEGGGLFIPDRALVEWLPTNPPAHTEWTTDINNDSGGRFKPLVKLFKWWRRQNPTSGRHPKGFVIECIVAECMDRQETHYGQLFVKTLERIVSKYNLFLSLGMVPNIADPGVPGNSVTSNISLEDFKSFHDLTREHAMTARAALEDPDAEESTRLWRQIFGSRFPSGQTSKSALLGEAAGSSFAGLSFPDHPVVPRKPVGFA